MLDLHVIKDLSSTSKTLKCDEFFNINITKNICTKVLQVIYIRFL